MRLTAFTDYGLRMLMRMAAAPERAFSTAELAEELGLSRHHLTKIMQRLARGGVVVTRRGAGGGATLARPAAEISLGAAVRLLEEGQPLVACLARGGEGCALDGRCRLKSRLRAAEAAFLAELDRATLADVALPSAPARPALSARDRAGTSAPQRPNAATGRDAARPPHAERRR
ncbi:RrF2 family transcriptional regulator [Oceanicella actignis]|uniref:RrF2 family transcriptional regulator n=1 Tax=Oceanicella actignis TaxID=1189325 RepID=UPI0011E8291C|nr:BadM/Rrf2 family transcriptional regulator [Oceanicella actignis]